ncbi:hypothetical protein [Poseidonocella sp. HB161398]|uniref:hypothetical protein n=1 Tax=Poseidonocella sp. HB161398 TaxID=2320855 RepID=UPI001109CC07|nr:hypothetical protein [Poseidonocella sp. HB161398]
MASLMAAAGDGSQRKTATQAAIALAHRMARPLLAFAMSLDPWRPDGSAEKRDGIRRGMCPPGGAERSAPDVMAKGRRDDGPMSDELPERPVRSGMLANGATDRNPGQLRRLSSERAAIVLKTGAEYMAATGD